MTRARTKAACLRSVEKGLYADLIPAPDFEEMTDDVLLRLSKLRDGMVFANHNIAACRVDEAMETVLAAYRGMEARS